MSNKDKPVLTPLSLDTKSEKDVFVKCQYCREELKRKFQRREQAASCFDCKNIIKFVYKKYLHGEQLALFRILLKKFGNEAQKREEQRK